VLAEVMNQDLEGRTLVIAGGEATLRPELSEWIAAARSQGAERVIVQTNGRMLAYAKLVRRLVRAGCDTFGVALHGHRADLHDWLTRSEGSFEQTLKGLDNLRAAGAVTLVNCVITRSNYRHMPQIVQLAARKGAAAVRFIWPRSAGDATAEWPMIEPEPTMVGRYAELASGVGDRLRVRVSFTDSDSKSGVDGHQEVAHVS